MNRFLQRYAKNQTASVQKNVRKHWSIIHQAEPVPLTRYYDDEDDDEDDGEG